MPIAFSLYRNVTALASPLMPLWLKWRMKKGKEDAARLSERLGFAGLPRPEGALLWIHGASVGEALSALALMEALHARFPHLRMLMTTGTVTSAKLLETKMPPYALHQFAAIDTPQAVSRFLDHWRPQAGLLIESEIWPNLIAATQQRRIPLALINARLSGRSFKRWQNMPAFARRLFSAFRIALAQNETYASRLRELGANHVHVTGTMKYDAPALPVDETVLNAWQSAMAGRKIWVAASTHAGEEIIIAKAHLELRAQFPNLLTIIVPRHPSRGAQVAAEINAIGLQAALRSQNTMPPPDCECYIADTMGELGLWYRLSPIAFIGGSLIAHGGQNPLEAIRLGAAIAFGPHMENFADMRDALKHARACAQINDENTLAEKIGEWFTDEEARRRVAAHAKHWLQSEQGAVERIMQALVPMLEETLYANS